MEWYSINPLIAEDSLPLNYNTPPFPSLYWPLGSTHSSYKSSYLYYTKEIWWFTVVWTMIFFAGFYCASGIIACVNNSRRSFILGGLYIIFYIVIGCIQGFISGTVVGIILRIAEIYRSGQFSMSTWIPMAWGVIQILFATLTSYSMTSVVI